MTYSAADEDEARARQQAADEDQLVARVWFEVAVVVQRLIEAGGSRRDALLAVDCGLRMAEEQAAAATDPRRV